MVMGHCAELADNTVTPMYKETPLKSTQVIERKVFQNRWKSSRKNRNATLTPLPVKKNYTYRIYVISFSINEQIYLFKLLTIIIFVFSYIFR